MHLLGTLYRGLLSTRSMQSKVCAQNNVSVPETCPSFTICIWPRPSLSNRQRENTNETMAQFTSMSHGFAVQFGACLLDWPLARCHAILAMFIFFQQTIL